MLLELLFSLIALLKFDFEANLCEEDIQELDLQIQTKLADIF